jgi:hypothetical protein
MDFPRRHSHSPRDPDRMGGTVHEHARRPDAFRPVPVYFGLIFADIMQDRIFHYLSGSGQIQRLPA